MLTNGDKFVFKPSPQKKWLGRYGRIVGYTSTFKIMNTFDYGFWPVLQWDYEKDRMVCTAVDCGEVEELVDAVNKAKVRLSSSKGGSFCINEFGQVIVPSGHGDGNRLLVGEVSGNLLFEDADGEIIDMADDSSLYTGDRWEKPYVGMQYNLSRGSYIYYYDNEDGSIYPPVQDDDLVRKLRRVRRYGPVRFIVNSYGLVLTKVPEGEFSRENDSWVPVYVGRINKNRWFRKES